MVAEVERLSTARMNQLLKILEEPPENTLILLSSSRKSALLPTLISRCFLWHVPPPNEDVFATVLGRLHKAQPLSASQVSSLRSKSVAPLAKLSFGWRTQR